MGEHFGNWLRDKRGRRGEPGFISQRELARKMGVDPTYVSQLERKAQAPSYETRQRIHKVLGTTEEELIALGIVKGTAPAPQSAQSVREERTDYSPFEKGTWHYVVLQRVRGMSDEQAEDVADYAEYILTKKKTQLPVIVRATKPRDRVAP